MSLTLYDAKLELPAFGLRNSGAICYFNSMLQCFLSCTSVLKVFDSTGIRTRNQLCAEVWTAITRAREGVDASDMSIRIWDAFREQMREKGIRTTIGSGMEDAHEGFVKFLEAFDAPELEMLFENRYKTVVQCGRCGDCRALLNDKNKPQIDTRVFCKLALEDFLKADVETLILQRDDETDADYRCSACNEKNVHSRIERLVFTPEVIILLFEKWEQCAGAKKATYKRWAADAPDVITIPGQRSEIRYRRVAMSEHGGDTDGGHYWAHARRRDGGYRLDDTRVSAAEAMPTMSTYMAWYHVV